MEDLECPVCTFVFRDPRLLPCSHCFCLICLARLTKWTPAVSDKCFVRCPFGCPELALPTLQALRDLPKNRNLAGLCEKLRSAQFRPAGAGDFDADFEAEADEDDDGIQQCSVEHAEELTVADSPGAQSDALRRLASRLGFAPASDATACENCGSARRVTMCRSCTAFLCAACAPMRDHAFCCGPDQPGLDDATPTAHIYPFFVTKAQAMINLVQHVVARGVDPRLFAIPTIEARHCQCFISKVALSGRLHDVAIEVAFVTPVYPTPALAPFTPEIERDGYIPHLAVPAAANPNRGRAERDEMQSLNAHLTSLQYQRHSLAAQHELQAEYQQRLGAQVQALRELQAVRGRQIALLRRLNAASQAAAAAAEEAGDDGPSLDPAEVAEARAELLLLVDLERGHEQTLRAEEAQLADLQRRLTEERDRHTLAHDEAGTLPAGDPFPYAAEYRARAEARCKELFMATQGLTYRMKQALLRIVTYRHTLLHDTGRQEVPALAGGGGADAPDPAGAAAADGDGADEPAAVRHTHFVPFYVGHYSVRARRGGGTTLWPFVVNGQTSAVYAQCPPRPLLARLLHRLRPRRGALRRWALWALPLALLVLARRLGPPRRLLRLRQAAA